MIHRKKNILISYKCVKGHTDNPKWTTFSELKAHKFYREETYNIWCDLLEQQEWSNGITSNEDPDVAPAEHWAVLSNWPYYHKISGSLLVDII
jgi:hypothetical protein